MKKKILSIFVMCVGIIVPALMAGNPDGKNNPTPSSNSRAHDVGDNIITPTYEHKGIITKCHGYVYEITTENGELLYEVFENQQETKPGYILINEIDGDKITCSPETEHTCYECSCGVLIIGK